MNRYFRISGALLIALSVSAASMAQVQKPGRYFEIPGKMVFSGEMIVRPWQPAQLQAKGKGLLEQHIIRTRAEDRIERWIVRHEQETDEYTILVPNGYNENTYSKALLSTGDYQYAEPNWFCYPAVNPNDQRYGTQWHHPKVKSPQAWDLVIGNSSQIVAVVDTGIDLTHPDLAPNRVPGYNSESRQAEVDGGDVSDINGHGTHVAGCAAAIGNNTIGVAGMGWNFRIMMVRTSNHPSGGAFIDDMMDGARWAAEHGAKSVSVSYAGVDAQAVGTTGTYIKSIGSLMLFAAGNDNRDLTGLNHPDTIVVGASDENDGKAGFSAYGLGVHVFAPGTNIQSTTLGGGYGPSSGTSMAAPVANGAVALIWAMNPGLTANQVQTILESNCDFIGPPAIFNKGRINQLKNVEAAAALLIVPVDVPPNGITTTLGTHLSGTLADILVPNTGGPSYTDVSDNPTRLGHFTGEEITFNSSVNPAKLVWLEFVVQVKLQTDVLATSFIYAWDYNANNYALIGQTPAKFNLWTTKKIKIQTPTANRYLGPGGNMKIFIRTLQASQGGRRPPFPFTFNLGHAKVAVGATP